MISDRKRHMQDRGAIRRSAEALSLVFACIFSAFWILLCAQRDNADIITKR